MTSNQDLDMGPSENDPTVGVQKRTCPPVRVGGKETVCCPPIHGEKAPCCKPRQGPPLEAPPGEGPTDYLPPLPDSDTMVELKEAYEGIHSDLFNDSLVKKYLTRPTFDDLKYKTTKDGNNLLDVIRSGARCPESVVGVYVPDADAYNRYSRLLDPIIWDFHAGFRPGDQHPSPHWGKPSALPVLDPDENIIQAVRISVRRNLQGIPLMQKMTEEKFRALEQQVIIAFGKLDGEYRGDYEPLSGMAESYMKDLKMSHLLFDSYDPHLQAAEATRLSKLRGVYMNTDKTFLVWVGVEDHLEIISMQRGSYLPEVYERLLGGVRKLDASLKYQTHPRLGYVSMCPSNLGNAVKGIVLMKLPYSGYDEDVLRANAAKLNLQINGTKMLTDNDQCEYGISNKRKVGLTEIETVKELADGIRELMRIEVAAAQSSNRTREEMYAEREKLQKAKENERQIAIHQRFARREPDGQYREHTDPRDGHMQKKRKDKGKKDTDDEDAKRDKKKDKRTDDEGGDTK